MVPLRTQILTKFLVPQFCLTAYFTMYNACHSAPLSSAHVLTRLVDSSRLICLCQVLVTYVLQLMSCGNARGTNLTAKPSGIYVLGMAA
jgi:hypothetical protein